MAWGHAVWENGVEQNIAFLCWVAGREPAGADKGLLLRFSLLRLVKLAAPCVVVNGSPEAKTGWVTQVVRDRIHCALARCFSHLLLLVLSVAQVRAAPLARYDLYRILLLTSCSVLLWIVYVEQIVSYPLRFPSLGRTALALFGRTFAEAYRASHA